MHVAMLSKLVSLVYVALVVEAADDGYYADLAYQDDAIDVVDLNQACPSDRVLRVRDTCLVDGLNIQCIKLRCCDQHVYISGRCVPESVNPCSLQLCEQACTVLVDRLWCTCHEGYLFSSDNYRRRLQPYCVDIDECANNNGGCSHRCVNDPGRHHCECPSDLVLKHDRKTCDVRKVLLEPLPLLRPTPRCFSSCDTVNRLAKKVEDLSDQLRSTQAALKQAVDNAGSRNNDDRFPDGTYIHRVLDSTAPLEGGFCRCERGPRGPPGPPGMEGPKGVEGLRGPRGARGPKGSLDLMLLLLADLRHDIHNLEARVYKEGEIPERFNMQKAWRHQRKQELAESESATDQPLDSYTVAAALRAPHTTIEVVHNSITGEIPHNDFESTTSTDWSVIKGDTESYDLDGLRMDLNRNMDEKLKQFYLLVNSTSAGDDDEDEDFPDYAFY